jgi:hypothetical protein
MHLAAAMAFQSSASSESPIPHATPLVAHRRVVRIDALQPVQPRETPSERCRGRVPDCLEGIGADMMARAGLDTRGGTRAAVELRGADARGSFADERGAVDRHDALAVASAGNLRP